MAAMSILLECMCAHFCQMYLKRKFCVKGYIYDQYKAVIQDDFTNLHTCPQWIRVHLFPYLLTVSIVSAVKNLF